MYNVKRLKENYPWPEQLGKPLFCDLTDSFSGDGIATVELGSILIKETIKNRNIKIMIESGVFLGSSCLKWLNSSKNVTVIGIDPWWDNAKGYIETKTKEANEFNETKEKGDPSHWFTGKVDFSAFEGDREAAYEQLDSKDGTYLTCLSNLSDYKNRFIPVRGLASEKLYELRGLGVKPELIFIDSTKDLEELEVCRKIFPDCILSGDDYRWVDEKANHRVKDKLNNFCKKYNYKLTEKFNTWILDKNESIKARTLSRRHFYVVSTRTYK